MFIAPTTYGVVGVKAACLTVNQGEGFDSPLHPPKMKEENFVWAYRELLVSTIPEIKTKKYWEKVKYETIHNNSE